MGRFRNKESQTTLPRKRIRRLLTTAFLVIFASSLLFVLWPSKVAEAAITLAANHSETVASASSTTIAHNISGAVAAGDLVVLDVCWFGTGTIQSVSGGSLSWSIDVNASPSGDRGVGFVSAIAPSGLSNGTTITVTFTAAQTDRGLGVSSWNGTKSSAYVGVSGTNTSATTAWTSGSVAITAGSLLMGMSHEDNAGDHTNTPTSPSLELRDATPSATDDFATEYRIESSAGSYEVAGTWSTGGSANSIGYVEYLANSNNAPAAPTLINPTASQTGTPASPRFELRTTDAENDYLKYKIDVCSTSNCSAIVRTIDQTSSQTGWAAQDQQSATAYTGNSTLSSSAIAVHFYQAPALNPNTQYWWRAYAIDPGGSNTLSSASSIATFTTGTPEVKIQGGVELRGGVKIGN